MIKIKDKKSNKIKTTTVEDIKNCECCYNCQHWNVDILLENEYLWNTCQNNDVGKLINSMAGFYCGNFINKTNKALTANVFGL